MFNDKKVCAILKVPKPIFVILCTDFKRRMSIFYRIALICFSLDQLLGEHVIKHVEVQFLPLHGAGEHENESAGKRGNIGALPLQHFMRMFPMDLPPGAHVRVIHLGGGGEMDHGDGSLGDQILNSILSELSSGFHTDMRPLMTSVQSAERETEHPCIADIQKFCGEAHGHKHEHMSDLHCLGLHAKEISMDCAKEVQQSLPFICSKEISQYCSTHQTVEQSVLQCLEDAVDGGNRMDQACKDSVGATRAVLNKMKTQNVALVDKRTGAVIRSTAKLLSAPIYFSVSLLVLFVVAILLYAFWMRDDETHFFKSVQKTLRDLRMRMGRKNKPVPPAAGKQYSTELKSGYSL
jgi:hypothetical protein